MDTQESNVMNIFENGSLKIVNWIKKSIAMMTIFILIGCSLGFYLSKIVYNIRMNEVTMVGGFIHDNKVYDVKLRP
jgi:hypothetical protein